VGNLVFVVIKGVRGRCWSRAFRWPLARRLRN